MDLWFTGKPRWCIDLCGDRVSLSSSRRILQDILPLLFSTICIHGQLDHCDLQCSICCYCCHDRIWICRIDRVPGIAGANRQSDHWRANDSSFNADQSIRNKDQRKGSKWLNDIKDHAPITTDKCRILCVERAFYNRTSSYSYY